MKKLLPFIAAMFLFVACNNSADENKTTKDTMNVEVNTHTTTHDTNSYDQMPNKINDDTIR